MTDTTTSTPVSREALRADLETTRTGYHDLLQSLADDDMSKKSGNPEWTVGQLMWHLAWGLDYIPAAVERARKGKNFSVPQGPFNFINPWITRIGARRATRDSLTQRYDASHAKVIASLDSVGDDDLSKGALFMKEMRTVQSYFEGPINHFKEHHGDILKGLGR
jgi:hypothetical protein